MPRRRRRRRDWRGRGLSNPLSDPVGPITVLLNRWHAGDLQAAEQLLPLVYEDLRRTAARQLRRETPGHTLSPTEVVHESYLRLEKAGVDWQNRQHFFAVAATAMRRILVEHARRRLAAKRGGEAPLELLDESLTLVATTDERLVALDEALEAMARIEPRFTKVVDCRFFVGLTEADTAAVLGVSERTVRRDWLKARGWLRATLDD